jgi:SAM-dependent methyltransferase
LPNVDFRPADLALPAAEPAAFDVVLSLGVVHHMADRGAALIRLREWLAPGGRILLWVYGRHGRHAHNLNQRFLRAVTRGREAPARHTAARAFVRELGGRFAAGSGFTTPRGCGADGLAYLLDRPQWLADQMIPAHEEPFDLPELFAHLAAAGLRCERWLGVPETLAELTDSRELLRGFARLSARERMLALDCLLKPDHYFLLVRPAARRATRRAASCASARPTKTGARR